MTPYCSATGTISTREKLIAAGWRVLVVATGRDKNYGIPYAIDNGAWHAYQNEKPFDVEAFRKVLEWSTRQELKPDWVVVPDKVASPDSLEFSLKWLPEVQRYSDISLLAVQDGMKPEDISPYLGPKIGVFLGGTTEFKLRTMMSWGKLCHNRCYFHVGRVNTVKRISYCAAAGANSFDGTSVCRFPKNLPRLDKARKQMALPLL